MTTIKLVESELRRRFLNASDLEIWDDETLSTSDLDRSKNEAAINQLVELIIVKSSTSDS
jgi:hypothetical protein